MRNTIFTPTYIGAQYLTLHSNYSLKPLLANTGYTGCIIVFTMTTSKTMMAIAMLGMSSVTQAFWRMECRGSTGTARIDPIVDLGKPAGHAHVAHGSSGEYLHPNIDHT